ncbi:MAG: EF-P beta-lysylation protein EpmB [Gammaproteobacteria bacterium]
MRDKAAYDTLKRMDNSRWQQQIRNGIKNRDELLQSTGHDVNCSPAPEKAILSFPVRVPEAYLNRIERNNLNDPLLRQVLPLDEEDSVITGFTSDPVGEFNKHASPGLIRKYHGRALLITTSSCAIHCRYCFRRHYPYVENQAGKENWNDALDVLKADPDIKEIILSGGDPLSLTDNKLESLINQLEQISHLKWLRIHTRMPVVVPTRVTDKLVRAISQNRFKQTLVLHINHPNEIDDEVIRRIRLFHDAGVRLLNQSVLLRGINDDALVLAELSDRLYTNDVLPYYLHMLDPVAGAAHFEVNDDAAKNIMHELRSRLPGYLVPRLVREVEGQPYKTPI